MATLLPTAKYLLYAEDDVDDQQTMRDVISIIDPTLEVVILDNGRKAFEYLQGLPGLICREQDLNGRLRKLYPTQSLNALLRKITGKISKKQETII